MLIPRRQKSPGLAGQGLAGGGFTLAEVITVVAVMAISAAIVIPYATGTSDFQAMAAVREISCDLEYAQSQAVVSQTPVTVTFDTTGETYTLSNASGPLIHPMTKGAYTIDFPARDGYGNVDVLSADFGGEAEVTFDATGAPDNAGTVRIQAPPHMYSVSVAAATGRVTVAQEGP